MIDERHAIVFVFICAIALCTGLQIFGDRREDESHSSFCPTKDITAYELALVVRGWRDHRHDG